jgi:predicted alpha/beta superfamily hydrolase
MKTFCFNAIIVLLLFSSIGVLNAQNVKDKVCLDNTEQFYITSKYVEGETYIIQVGLPFNYSNLQKSYPVLYVLDGDYEFGMAKEIAEHLIFGNDIKDIFVVGISYGQGMDAWWNKRARDLSPSKDTIWDMGKQFPNAGGADNFLKFIQYELFPVVNKNYRIKQDSVAIFGHSFGGLFAAYILFKQPELFKGYIISSPPVLWNNKSLLKLEAEYFSNHKELNKIVYLSIGSLENWNDNEFINNLNELSKNIQEHNYVGLTLVTRIFEGETHTSVPSSALNRGMRTLFKP